VAVDPVELAPVVNELGNCMLPEKNFNISKRNKPLKALLDEVHKFEGGNENRRKLGEPHSP
jgi:hypothetical protein